MPNEKNRMHSKTKKRMLKEKNRVRSQKIECSQKKRMRNNKT
jgi:hypothetical protein